MARIAPFAFSYGTAPARYERAIPVDLIDFMPIKTFKRSLKTSQKREAISAARRVDGDYEALVSEARRAKADGWVSWEAYKSAKAGALPAGQSYLKVPEGVYVAGLVHSFRRDLDALAVEFEANPIVSMDDASNRRWAFHLPLPESLKSADATFAADLDACRDPFAMPPAFTHRRMLEALSGSGLAIDPADRLHARHWRAFAQTSRAFGAERDAVFMEHAGRLDHLTAYVEGISTNFGPMQSREAWVAIQPVARIPVPRAPPSPSAAPLFSDAAREVLALRTMEANTRKQIQYVEEVFIDVLGDKRIDQYTKADARAFEAVMRALPARWRRDRTMRGMTAPEAAAYAQANGLEPADGRTVHKNWGHIAFAWRLIVDRYDDHVSTNPFAGIKVERPDRDPRDLKDVFEVAELNAIFRAPLYTGMKSKARMHQPGDMIDRDSWRYWAPVVSLFSGARLAEIVGIRTEDVGELDGIPYIAIRPNGNPEEGGRRIKTRSSKRDIPIHRTLIEIGFVDFCKRRQREGSGLLFPDAAQGKASRNWSSVASTFYHRFLKAADAKRANTSFHSTRHTFEDGLRNAGADQGMIDFIQGHSVKGMGGSYGRGHALRVKRDVIDRVEYPGLDLSHLKAG